MWQQLFKYKPNSLAFVIRSLGGRSCCAAPCFVHRCKRCNQFFLPCQGKTKLGEDHPDTLTSLNNLALVFEAQGRLADAEPLYREALEKCPGPQFQRDFMHSIRSRNLLDFHLLSFSLVVLLLLRRPDANSVAGVAFCEM